MLNVKGILIFGKASFYDLFNRSYQALQNTCHRSV